MHVYKIIVSVGQSINQRSDKRPGLVTATSKTVQACIGQRGQGHRDIIFPRIQFPILAYSAFLAEAEASTTSHGLGGALGNGMPAARSRSLRARPMAHAAVPRFRPQTRPTAAHMSMKSLEGLNWLEMPNSDAA